MIVVVVSLDIMLVLPFCNVVRVGRGASRNDLGSGTNWPAPPPVDEDISGSSLLLRLPLLLLLLLLEAAECFFVEDKDAANSSASFRALDSDSSA